MWFLYAMLASVIWGVSYAASGRAIDRGVSPTLFFTLYAGFGALMGLSVLAVMGKLATIPEEIRSIGKEWPWLAIAVVASGVGALFI
ncbi:MAG: hypothetical protein ACREKL_10195, partial [Chthoniobacterales bacterium]